MYDAGPHLEEWHFRPVRHPLQLVQILREGGPHRPQRLLVHAADLGGLVLLHQDRVEVRVLGQVGLDGGAERAALKDETFKRSLVSRVIVRPAKVVCLL